MADIAKLSREQLLAPEIRTAVERLVSRIVAETQGKKAYLLAELLRTKLGDLAQPQSPEERAYLHMLMELDVVAIPLHPEDEVIALFHEALPMLLDLNVDIAERLHMKLVDLPVPRREAFRKKLLDLIAQLKPSPARERLQQAVASWQSDDGFFVKHADGSWDRVGTPAPVVAKPIAPPAPAKAPAPLPELPSPPEHKELPPPPQQKQAPPVVMPSPPSIAPRPKPIPPPAEPPRPTPPPITRPSVSQKPQMHDIKPSRPLSNPFDELRTIDLERMKRHGDGPEQFFRDVEEQIRSFQKGGTMEYAKAVTAWRESPLFDLYRSIARESLVQKEPLATIIAARTGRGEVVLEEPAIEAIRSLNEHVRLG
ncbi:MAG: hypothetical protein Q7S89_03125 [bacterium]|nr:hypothetical protein [bacterium]